MSEFWRRVAALDQRLSNRMRIPEEFRAARFAAMAVAHLGDTGVWLAASALAYWKGSADVRRVILLMGAAVVVAVTIGAAVKTFVRRRRPPEHPSGLYSRRWDRHSFPSGHAGRVAAVAMSISFAFPEWTLAAWAYALGVAATRVMLGVHWLGDVLFGLALGSTVGVVAFLVLGG
jgi:undecaprenyl-diphosphatase